jgi:hypothetical protein
MPVLALAKTISPKDEQNHHARRHLAKSSENGDWLTSQLSEACACPRYRLGMHLNTRSDRISYDRNQAAIAVLVFFAGPKSRKAA